MNSNWRNGKSTIVDKAASKLDRTRLRALIDQAIGDSVDESDEHAGLLSMIREEVPCPFPARVDGEDVECIRFDWRPKGYGLNAVCKGSGEIFAVDISKLQCTEQRPQGYEWIEAYFAWLDLIG